MTGFGRGVGKGIVTLVACGALAAGLAGCVIRIEGRSTSEGSRAAFESTKRTVVEHTPGAATEVKTEFGRVEVRRTARDDIRIEAKVACVSRERADRARIATRRESDGTLRIGVDWPDGRREKGEGCSFRIELPGSDGMRVETRHGAIVVEGLGGPADLRTSFGSVRVIDHAGPVRVRTSHGGIQVVGGGGPVDVETSFGAVDVALADENRGPVRIATSHGAISFRPGSAFEGEVELRTSHASIELIGANETTSRPVRLHSLGGSEAKFSIGSGGERSRLETSFGGITVDLRSR